MLTPTAALTVATSRHETPPVQRGGARTGDADSAHELALGEAALHVDGDLLTARAAFGRAYDLADSRQDSLVMARAAIGLGGMWVHEHRWAVDAARVEAQQRRALSLVEHESAVGLRLRLRLAAEADYRSGSATEVMRLLDEARRTEDPVAVAEGLSLAHHCLLGPEHGNLRLSLADELLRVAASSGRPSDTVMGLLWRASDLLLSGIRQAGRAYEDLVGHSAANRNAAASFVTQAIRVMLTIRDGRLSEAEALAETCLRAGAAAGDADGTPWYMAQLVAVRWFQGRIGDLVDPISTLVNSPNLSIVDSSFVAAQAVAYASAGQIQQARGALARITGSDLEGPASSSSWLAAMTATIEAAALLNDAPAAARAYQLLLPYAHLPVMASMGVACFGSAQHPLGVACLVTGDYDLAIEHLEAAVDHNAGLSHWPATTLSRHRLGEALAARGAPGDATDAKRLHGESTAEAAAYGMQLPPLAVWGRAAPCPPPRWTRSGGRWRIEMFGRSVIVEDMVGMHHLATLVANPGTDIPAIELVRADQQGSAVRETAQPVLDREALRQYRSRLQKLTEEIDEEKQFGGAARVATLQAEVDWILHEVQATTGLGGRPRSFPGDAERARIAVGKAIRRALARIGDGDEVLGAELRAGIETGVRCCYRPADGSVVLRPRSA